MDRAILLPTAKKDYQIAYAWYEQRGSDLAKRFEAAVDLGLQSVVDFPNSWPRLNTRHRFHKLKRFPFSIVYRVVAGKILVVAVAHFKRRSSYWKRRR
jgi:plasmid stabilization system protein ParE